MDLTFVAGFVAPVTVGTNRRRAAPAATHLTLTQVAAELFQSPHTVRPPGPQATSIYRKLGAPARSHAVARAGHLGLLDG